MPDIANHLAARALGTDTPTNTATAPVQPSVARLYFLDWLRIAAFGLLVLYHVGMYYVSWGWHVKSPHAGPALEPWMMLSSPWRMTLLFIVSGAATSFLLLREGASGVLLRSRAKRLLLPLLFGMLVIVPPQSFFEVVQRFGYAGSYLDFMRLYLGGDGGFCSAPGRCLILPTWNHLWFLPYLFFYTLALWAGLRWRPQALDALAARLPAALRGTRLLWLPVLFLLATRLGLRPWFPVSHALVDDWFAHTQYAAAFLLGAALARGGAMWPRMETSRWPALLVALAAWGLLVSPVPAAVSGLPLLLLRAVAVSAMQWCAIVAAVGFAHRYLNRDGAARRYLSEAVFPVYILHQTLIILLAQALAPLALAAAVEAPLLVAGTFVLAFAGFEAVRRVSFLRPLFGLARRAYPRGYLVPKMRSPASPRPGTM